MWKRPATTPQAWLPALKAAGIKVIHKCTSVRHSLKAQSIGCDAVSVDGFECGGHPGEDDVLNFILLPRAGETLDIPFVASGGMADARSAPAAALAMGAEGMNLGTRFIATAEAPGARARQTSDRARLGAGHASDHGFPAQHRAGIGGMKPSTGCWKGADTGIGPEVRGHHPRGGRRLHPAIMQRGEMDAGGWSCGMVVGLIQLHIPTCKELIDRIMSEAEAIIRGATGAASGRLKPIGIEGGGGFRLVRSSILAAVAPVPGGRSGGANDAAPDAARGGLHHSRFPLRIRGAAR